MALLYGRAGRLTTKNGGFRPGQIENTGIAASLLAAPAAVAEALPGPETAVFGC